MLNNKILTIIGYILLFLGCSMLFSAGWSHYYQTDDINAILKSFLITTSFSIFLILISQIKFTSTAPYVNFRKIDSFELNNREGYTIVTTTWIAMALFSALPFYISGVFDNYTDSFFEAMSGLTTTGASVLLNIENTPKGVLFWRSFTQFIGGMGIIVFSVAILPLLGFGGVQLFRAEMAGPVADKLTPRVKQTAKLLWSIYIGLIIAETLILYFEGLSVFDALSLSFTTIATAGFSTQSDSIASFSPLVQYTIVCFMILGATNFALHYLFVGKRKIEYIRDYEFKLYISFIVIFTFIFFINNTWINNNTPIVQDSFRTSLFTAVSLLTTTGFSNTDYQLWGSTSKIFIFLLFFIGGSAGSTTGGLKIIRTILVFKYLNRELKKLIHPKGVFHITIGKKKISEETVNNTVGFYLFYIFIFIFTFIFFGLCGINFETALSAAASAIGNIGPGLGMIGPAHNWAFFPDAAKWVAAFVMLLGRLEIFTVILIFSRVFSKK